MAENRWHYPETLEIQPFGNRTLSATVSVPGSKSVTNRALVLAALCSRSGECLLRGALQSEDTEIMVDCLQRLGFDVEPSWDIESIRVGTNQSDRIIPASKADLFVGNSGTTMRFVTAMVKLGQGEYRLDGVARMRKRPVQDLLGALNWLGVDAACENSNGCPPVVLKADGWKLGEAWIRNNVSSQFLSGLMMAAPFAALDSIAIIYDETLVSLPYLEMTDAMLRDWGIEIGFREASRTLRVTGNHRAYRPDYRIEPDASAASYFFAMAAILGGRVTVLDLPEKSLQGDVHFVDLLAQMGCRVKTCTSGITIHGGPLHGIDVDMNAISDTVMTLAAVACFADGPTTIRNVAHIRHKETDRISALATELRKMGALVDEFADGLRITPAPLHAAEIDTYNDHRMAMSMALIGLKVPGIVIRNPGCVAKTYPGYWHDLEKM